MRSVFLRMVGIILVLAAIVFTVGCFLPRDYDIRATVTIDAPPSEVFPHLNTLADWQEWSPWNSDDVTGFGIKYSGPEAGEGASQTWRDPRGEGTLRITFSRENKSVEYAMEFAGFPGMGGQFELNSVDEDTQTRVTWASEGTLPSGAFYGYFSTMFSAGMQSEYEKSLARLKKVVESPPR